MKKTVDKRTLATYWSPHSHGNGSSEGPGLPVACVATTYTFDAKVFEVDLLPRFLGLRGDATEGERTFVAEREQALGTVGVCVLVDRNHFDPTQSTLRWDQLPVHVPGSVQHSKIVVLIWERLMRIIVSSANLTPKGYRKNREIAGAFDFNNSKESAPRKLAIDTLNFLEDVSGWVNATPEAIQRLNDLISSAKARLQRWKQMPVDFSPRETPKVIFVPGLPRRPGGGDLSVIDSTLSIWGGRRATEVVVLTPFVGEPGDSTRTLVRQLVGVARRDAPARLAAPLGKTSDSNPKRKILALPKSFLQIWSDEWGYAAKDVGVYVVPPYREGKGERGYRELHAKSLYLTDYERALLLCGSSNFTPHGMGVGVANIEANLCYMDNCRPRKGNPHLRNCMPIEWETDFCERPIWPEEAAPLEEDLMPNVPTIPDVFLYATYNQQEAKLIVFLDKSKKLPVTWFIRLMGENADEYPPLASQREFRRMSADGKIVVTLPEAMRNAHITCVRLHWVDAEGNPQEAFLPVQVEKKEDLLPPEEFRALSADAIMDCLISGKDPIEWIECQEWRRRKNRNTTDAAVESLRAVDTSGYALYRVRKLGRALSKLGERIQKTVRTPEAISYRLNQDPLGPSLLAESFVSSHCIQDPNLKPGGLEKSEVAFSLAEIALVVAHAGRKIYLARERREPDFRLTFRKATDSLLKKAMNCFGEDSGNRDRFLKNYIRTVNERCRKLLNKKTRGERHAG